MVVEAVAAEGSGHSEAAELGVADRAGGVLVIHGVPTGLVRLGRFDDDVAAQVGDFAAIGVLAEVVELERAIEGEFGAVDGFDEAFLGLAVVADAGLERLLHLVLAGGRGEDDAVADAPAGDRLLERHLRLTSFDRGAELEPGAAHGGAVELHAAAAADDGGAGFLVHAFEVVQADAGGLAGGDGVVGRSDEELGARLGGIGLDVRGAVEAFLIDGVAGLDADEANMETGVAVGGEAQGAGDMQGADRLLGVTVVDDGVAGSDDDDGAGGGNGARFPGGGGGQGPLWAELRRALWLGQDAGRRRTARRTAIFMGPRGRCSV